MFNPGKQPSSRRDLMTLGVMTAMVLAILVYWSFGRARRKMDAKGTDAIFMNRGDLRGSGMESPGNSGELLFPDGGSVHIPPGSKRFVAEAITAALGLHFGETGSEGRDG